MGALGAELEAFGDGEGFHHGLGLVHVMCVRRRGRILCVAFKLRL